MYKVDYASVRFFDDWLAQIEDSFAQSGGMVECAFVVTEDDAILYLVTFQVPE